IDIAFSKNAFGVLRLAGTTIENWDPCGHATGQCLQLGPDEGVNFLSLLRCGRKAGTDGPYGFVCHNHLCHLLRRKRAQGSMYLGGHHIAVSALLPLLTAFATAIDRLKSMLQEQ